MNPHDRHRNCAHQHDCWVYAWEPESAINLKKKTKKRSVTPQSETLNYITATRRHFWDVLTSLLQKGRRHIVHLYLCQ